MTENREKSSARDREGVITALIGLALNLALGVAKLVFGIFTGSVSIMSDAANNLSDVGTSAVTVGSFVLTGKKADRDHPYGHGRYEYIAGLIISVLIVMVGFELIKTSVSRILGGESAEFSLAALIVLIVSVAVKLSMAVMYTVRNRKLKSETIAAARFDSISDCIVTSIVAAAFVASAYTSFPVDAVCGIAAALFIVVGGIKILSQMLNKLLGGRASSEVENELNELILSYPSVLGTHDLRVHDYGEEHKIASADAEFDKNMSFAAVHEIVDEIERAAYKKFGINLVVHSDPVDVSDERYLTVRRAVVSVLEPYGVEASFHELNFDDENKVISLHLRLAERLMRERDAILSEIIDAVSAVINGYSVSAEYDFM